MNLAIRKQVLFCGVLALGFISTSAMAKVSSVLSQEELFVCSAGLSHPKINTNFPGGVDRLVYQYEDFSVPEDSEARFRMNDLSVKAGGSARITFDPNVDVFSQKLLQTNFDFSTESYGSTYFVDLCYRGPIGKVDKNTGQDETEGIYELSLALQAKQDDQGTYSQESGLVGSVSVQCDLRALGRKRAARIESEKSPGALENDLYYSSDTVSVKSSTLQLNLPLNDLNASVPRFCRIRVGLSETQFQKARHNSAFLKEVDVFVNISKE